MGNLDSLRDWGKKKCQKLKFLIVDDLILGHARDYVECMWKMLQLDHAEDFVIATGEMHSVREFVQETFK